MKNRIASITFAAVAIALGIVAFQQRQTINALREELAVAAVAEPPARRESPATQPAEHAALAETQAAAPSPPAATIADSGASERPAESSSDSNRRVMRDLATMMENPQMNEIMQASQRATLEVIYKDLIDRLQLSPEERTHFMDILMARQMFRMETSMKMMGGASDADEMKLLAQEMKDYDEMVKGEIDTFLNDADDSADFEFYEKTMQERMALSGFKAGLAKSEMPLADGVDDQLVQIMADQKKAHTFKSDLADESNYSLDANRFSDANISALEQDLNALHAAILDHAAALLTSEQLAAFDKSLAQMRQMQISQVKMAANMFGQKSGD